MTYEFHDDFAVYADGEHPVGWLVEEHAARVHRHGCVQNGAYALLLRGNKHMPCLPPLRDFVLQFDCHGDPGVTEVSVYVFWRYNPETMTGYFLKRFWTRQTASTEFGVVQNNVPLVMDKHLAAAGFTADPDGTENRLRLEVRGDAFALYHNDVAAGVFVDAARTIDCAGQIAFDRPHARAPDRGALLLKNLSVFADESVERQTLVAPLSVLFPADYNGLLSPFNFHLQASALAGCVEVKVCLTGGPAERRDSTFDGYKKAQRWMNELMTGPYLRIETGAGRLLGKFYLHRGTVGLHAHWDRQATALPPAQIECPIERTFMLPHLPSDAKFFFGYDYYEAEERQMLKGGPTEIMVDPATGSVLYGGPALQNRKYHLDLQSGVEKRICALIPKDDPRYAEACAFAENNHYFYADEPVVFKISACCRNGASESAALKMSVRLLDVFSRPIEDWRDLPLIAGHDAQAGVFGRLGFGVFAAALDLGKRSAGVYHVELRLQLAGATVASLMRAFEVMPVEPNAVSAPVASGLPELLCGEFFEYLSPAAAFDPWVGRGVDEYHYVSHNVFDAAFARRNKTKPVLRLYRRPYMLWLCPWMPERGAPEAYGDLLAEADLIYAGGVMSRFDLWRRDTYARRVGEWGLSCSPQFFDCFLEFLRSPAFLESAHSGLSAEVVDARGNLTEEEFDMLVDCHWKAWLEFFNRWYAASYAPMESKRMQALAPNAQWGWFGPYPPYGSVYKSAYFARYMGRDLTRAWYKAWQGPLRFESYPCICGYPIQRDVFMLASMKMEAPDMRLYPEVYGLVACPTDGHVMNGSPPYGRIRASAQSFPKRFFEYAYAAVWFDGTAFRYWQDNGLQPTHWAREHFAALLATWPIIREVRPCKPSRSTAFVYSRTACMSHPDYHECRKLTYAGKSSMPDDIFNTAEEAIAFAYEQARLDGQSAGFLTELRHLANLASEDVDTLVLPPLAGLADDEIRTIRRCHEAGMNLLAFENVTGIEDLFGVAVAEDVAIGDIFLAHEYQKVAPWSELAEIRERTAHPLCRAHYRENGCRSILTGASPAGASMPVLTIHETKWGKTALFTVPPTVVRREDSPSVHTYGSASMSRLMNRATALVLRQLGSPTVTTTAGKLIAFWDTQGALRIIVEEDAAPEPALPIEAFVTIRMSGRAIKDIVSAHQFAVIKQAAGMACLRLCLAPHECAMLTVRTE